VCCRENSKDVLYEKQLDIEATVNYELDLVQSDKYILLVGNEMRVFQNSSGERNAKTEDLVGNLLFEQPSRKAQDLFYVYLKTKSDKRLLCAINPFEDSQVLGRILKTAIYNDGMKGSVECQQ